MKQLTPEQLALAVVIAACENKSRSKLKDRVATSIIEDCLDMLRKPDLCPAVSKFKPGGFDPQDREMRAVAQETQALLQAMAPLVNAMTEADIRGAPRRRA